uniref:Gate domain-containing protein n=1 Tax=Hymenolepis diminuta TaxID=6216 RepID=A0A0R3SNP4_HYMDI
LPWIGFLLSALLAFICRRSRAEILTIAIETGIQNIGIAILVLLYSMSQPEGDIGAIMPLVVSFSTPFPLLLVYVAIAIKERRCSKCCWKKTFNKSISKTVEDLEYGEEHKRSILKNESF